VRKLSLVALGQYSALAENSGHQTSWSSSKAACRSSVLADSKVNLTSGNSSHMSQMAGREKGRVTTTGAKGSAAQHTAARQLVCADGHDSLCLSTSGRPKH
jgi:hypothetical protein